ncbi:MAG TPA: hypothetical protein VI750_13260 [Pyrinomonadaceae bacterium]|nr:hypothetical protein [Pyrinomonadaceae bacterium]
MGHQNETFTSRLLIVLGALLVSVITSASCGGALFRVKPVADLPPLPDSSKSANAGGITIRVAPMLTDEESQELFEANLPLAGLLPVRVELVHESGIPVETKRARFRLRDGQGREWKWMSAKQASSRILKANGVFAYNPNSRKQFEKEFAAYGIELKTPLTTTDRRRQGFLFFQSPNKEPVTTPRELTLIVERLPQPVEIKLN